MAPRTTDLDTIAPDDIDVISTKPPSHSISPKPISPLPPRPIVKPKKIKKSKTASPRTSSEDLKYRQKVYELVGKAKHPLASFLPRPKFFTFQQRDDNEEIILVLRRHWFTNLHWILLSLIMVIAPLFFTYFSIPFPLPTGYKIIAFLFWYLFTFVYAFENFLSWYFNVFILTEERVFDIDFYNLLVKEVTEAKISMIQDVTYNVIGFLPTILNYGNLNIQTASEVPMIHIDRIPNPEVVAKILQQMRLEEEQEALEGRVS